ncbi:MAG: hypothetical protein AAFO69_17825 [Bacteroidota bacterium]
MDQTDFNLDLGNFEKLDKPTLFVASPSDVSQVREKAKKLFYDLSSRLAYAKDINIHLWEDHFMDYDPSKTVQENTPLTNDPLCIGVIFIFGERIGSYLPYDFPVGHLQIDQNKAFDVNEEFYCVHPHSKMTSHGFPLTGSVFEYLLTQKSFSKNGKKSNKLVLFIGDDSLYNLDEVDAQFWGENRFLQRHFPEDFHLEHERKKFEKWWQQSGKPQRAWLKNFFNYIQTRRLAHEPVVVSTEEAVAKIEVFISELLGISEKPRNPFRHLAHYDVEDEDVFFGRSGYRKAVIEEIEDRLKINSPKKPCFVALYGLSGSGKSSLMRAGIIGTLVKRPDHWIQVVVRPSELRRLSPETDDPPAADPLVRLFQTFVGAIRQQGRGIEIATDFSTIDQSKLAEECLHRLITALHTLALGTEAKYKLIIGIDQAEEFLSAKDQQKLHWSSFLRFLQLASETGQVAVLCTFPSHQKDDMLQNATFNNLFEVGYTSEIQFPEQYSLIIKEAFSRVGLSLEDELRDHLLQSIKKLVATMRGHQHATILPLLSLCMSKLYQRYEEDKEQKPEIPTPGEELRRETDEGGASNILKLKGNEAIADPIHRLILE